MFADYTDIDAQIIDILNANANQTFSTTVDTSDSGDDRRSTAAITEARRKSAYRIFAAIGMNVSHPYWNEYSTSPAVTHGGTIPTCYGNIGTPLIQPYSGFTGGVSGYLTGIPKRPEEIESVRMDSRGSFTNYFGTAFAHNTARKTDVIAPTALWYSTQNGKLLFTGYAAKIPLIAVPATVGAAETQADTKIPLELAATNVRLAVGLLMKEGDANIIRMGLAYAQWGEADLIDIRNGAVRTEPINISRAVGLSQTRGI